MRGSPDGVERRDAVRAFLAARHLYEGGAVDTRWIQKRFGVAPRTARRDLTFIRLYLPVQHRRVGRGKNALRRLTLKGEP